MKISPTNECVLPTRERNALLDAASSSHDRFDWLSFLGSDVDQADTQVLAQRLASALAEASHGRVLVIKVCDSCCKDLTVLEKNVGVVRWSKVRLPQTQAEFEQRLTEYRLHFDRVLFVTALGTKQAGLRRIAAMCGQVMLVVPPTETARYRSTAFCECLSVPVMRLVSFPDGEASYQGCDLPEWLQEAIILSGDSAVKRVARRIAKRRVGLALSAGAAKGLAHIGVIQVLEEQGIEVDAVAGCSMGAYVGACWCAGHDGKGLETLAASISTKREAVRLVDPVFPPRRGFIRGLRAKTRLDDTLKGAFFHELERPLHVVATDLEILETSVFSHGHVASAVHASLAMPGICTPVTLNGRNYTDGGASDPLPVDVLERLGMDKIIAVNVHPSLEDLAMLALDQGYREGKAWTEAARVAGRFLNQRINYFAKGNVLDTVMRGLQAGQIRLAEILGRQADVYIHAYTTGTRWYAFDAYAEAIETGRRAALASLPALKALTKPLSKP